MGKSNSLHCHPFNTKHSPIQLQLLVMLHTKNLQNKAKKSRLSSKTLTPNLIIFPCFNTTSNSDLHTHTKKYRFCLGYGSITNKKQREQQSPDLLLKYELIKIHTTSRIPFSKKKHHHQNNIIPFTQLCRKSSSLHGLFHSAFNA